MKKFFALSLVAAVIIAYANNFANAKAADEIKYSRVESESVTLYMDSALTVPWFTLPYGYYVKIISLNGSAAKVEYKGDSAQKPSAKGYVAVADLNISDTVPSSPYPSLTLTVDRTTMLYLDVDFSITETVTQNSTIDFYGILTRAGGAQYIYGYVSSSSGDRYVGYLPINSVYPFTVPRLEIEDKPQPSDSSDESGSDTAAANNALGNNLQILLIVAISVVAVSIVYLLFRPSSQKAKDEVITRSEIDDE